MPTVTDTSAEDFTTAVTELPDLNTGGTEWPSKAPVVIAIK